MSDLRGVVERLTISGSGGGITALTGDVTASGTGSVAATVKNNLKLSTVGFTSANASGISTGKVSGFVVCPFAGTITAFNFVTDTGTATVQVWKIATGTAKPTVANSINTSGVSISTGTALRSTTLSDFTTTSVAANDIFAFNISAVSGPTELSFQLEVIRS